MRTLQIKNFACIDDATVKIGEKLTVLIGPQASGKSVISKLIYFFQSLLIEERQSLEENLSLDAFRDAIKDKFLEWFPIESHGGKIFTVSFNENGESITIARTHREGKAHNNIKLWLPKSAQQRYNGILSRARNLMKTEPSEESDLLLDDWVVHIRRLHRDAHKERASDAIWTQLFIPAGRSFFTSVGRSIVAFDQPGFLDPVTRLFGRQFNAALQRQRTFGRHPKIETPVGPFLTDNLDSLLGGQLVTIKEKDYVRNVDGRLIPVHLLSSGQQEVLPLLVMLMTVAGSKGIFKQTVFIEEPEAHLFPEAQSTVLQALVQITNSPVVNPPQLFITTHSPYVLLQLNNFIKAGQLARDNFQIDGSLAEIIPAVQQLRPEHVEAYAIKDGQLNNIKSADGLIDAEYIDSVSENMMAQFSDLLDWEGANIL